MRQLFEIFDPTQLKIPPAILAEDHSIAHMLSTPSSSTQPGDDNL